MTDQELDHFRTLLEEIRDELRTTLSREDTTREGIRPDNAIGRLTRMEAIQAQSMTDEGRRRQENRLRQVEVALERIEEKQYGICVRCGGEIPKGRLEVMPETRLCVACAARRG